MAGAIRLEKNHRPVVYVVADNFLHDALSAAEDNGMPDLRIVGIPATAYNKNRISPPAIAPVAADALDSVIDALTRPLDAMEPQSAPRPAIPTKAPMVALTFAGDTYAQVLEEFNQHFIDHHWGSGLPLIPPTRERLEWMLAGTHFRPEHVIGRVAPRNGMATVEKIAINTVMAGAKPEYLPVIIAVMEAITDSDFDLLHMTASTGSFSLQIMVNGTLGQRIGVNAGIGLLGYGWRANNTIGHAVRLCLINLGHVWPAENDMALIGRASSHTCLVFAENQELSPWPPYHVGQGFGADTDCVTVATTMSNSSLGGATILGGGAVEPWTAASLLDNMVQAVARARRHMVVWKRGSAIPGPQRYIFVLCPELATELDRMGYDQHSLGRYLFEQTRIYYDDLSDAERASLQRRVDDGEIPSETVQLFRDNLNPGGRVPLLLRPGDCHILVAGGIPGYAFVTEYFSIPPYSKTAIMTKAIQ